MQLSKKLYNNRLSNHYDNIGKLCTGITKDIDDITKIVSGLHSYGS
jgi:hypothetical protein